MIVFYGFANEEYIYTYGLWSETDKVIKLSHMQKSCTPTVPCSEKNVPGDGNKHCDNHIIYNPTFNELIHVDTTFKCHP
jgi:hypothetical protein